MISFKEYMQQRDQDIDPKVAAVVAPLGQQMQTVQAINQLNKDKKKLPGVPIQKIIDAKNAVDRMNKNKQIQPNQAGQPNQPYA